MIIHLEPLCAGNLLIIFIVFIRVNQVQKEKRYRPSVTAYLTSILYKVGTLYNFQLLTGLFVCVFQGVCGDYTHRVSEALSCKNCFLQYCAI